MHNELSNWSLLNLKFTHSLQPIRSIECISFHLLPARFRSSVKQVTCSWQLCSLSWASNCWSEGLLTFGNTFKNCLPLQIAFHIAQAFQQIKSWLYPSSIDYCWHCHLLLEVTFFVSSSLSPQIQRTIMTFVLNERIHANDSTYWCCMEKIGQCCASRPHIQVDCIAFKKYGRPIGLFKQSQKKSNGKKKRIQVISSSMNLA